LLRCQGLFNLLLLVKGVQIFLTPVSILIVGSIGHILLGIRFVLPISIARLGKTTENKNARDTAGAGVFDISKLISV
jgi:hypothetical protein